MRSVRSHEKCWPPFWWTFAWKNFLHGQIFSHLQVIIVPVEIFGNDNTCHETRRNIHSEAGRKRSSENLASSADVMETEEDSARLGQDAEKIFGVTGRCQVTPKRTQWRFHCGVLRQAGQNAAYGHTKNLATFLVDLLLR